MAIESQHDHRGIRHCGFRERNRYSLVVLEENDSEKLPTGVDPTRKKLFFHHAAIPHCVRNEARTAKHTNDLVTFLYHNDVIHIDYKNELFLRILQI